MRGFLECGFETTRAAKGSHSRAFNSGGRALMEKEYVQAEAYSEPVAYGYGISSVFTAAS